MFFNIYLVLFNIDFGGNQCKERESFSKPRVQSCLLDSIPPKGLIYVDFKIEHRFTYDFQLKTRCDMLL